MGIKGFGMTNLTCQWNHIATMKHATSCVKSRSLIDYTSRCLDSITCAPNPKPLIGM
ncbi:hypothetical protein CRYUN_Cryun27aG0021900 [Craigia yunnanensis]